MIKAEREGDEVDRSLLGSVLRALQALGLYVEHFEPRFLTESGEFYVGEAARHVQLHSAELAEAGKTVRLTQARTDRQIHP